MLRESPSASVSFASNAKTENLKIEVRGRSMESGLAIGGIVELDRSLAGDAPKLAKIDLKLKYVQATARKSSMKKGAAWVGAISLGLFSGFIPADLLAAASDLGFTKIAAEINE